MIVTLLLSLVIVILLHYYIVHYRRSGRLLDQIPGPQALPIFGNVIKFYNRTPEELWYFLDKFFTIYYPVIKVWSFTVGYVFIRHPDDMETIMNNTKHIEKGYIYDFLQSWLQTGLLTSTGSKWHRRRRILTPAFHFNILKQFFEILVEERNRIIESLKNSEGTTVENLMSFISHHTLNIICAALSLESLKKDVSKSRRELKGLFATYTCILSYIFHIETAMGTSLHDMGEQQQEYRDAVHLMGKVFFYRIMKPWLYNDFIFSLTPMGRKQTKSLKILHGFTEKIIAERRRYHEHTGGRYLKNLENDSVTETDDTEMTGIRKKRLAMLDLLIAYSHENGLSDLDIREEVDTFMFEGHDTVAIGICFTLLLLAEHKDIQDRVRSEVNAVMQENGGKLTMAALSNLMYLERCIKESLRLYPSVPLIARKTANDTKIQKYMLPSGTSIILSIYHLHRDPNFWPNPDIFDPDRFLPENIINRHPYSYIPFSAGPRNCIGQRFAMMELKTMVAYLLHNFQLEPVDYLKDFRFSLDLVTRVTRPIRMKFIPIERSRQTETNSDQLV